MVLSKCFLSTASYSRINGTEMAISKRSSINSSSNLNDWPFLLRKPEKITFVSITALRATMVLYMIPCKCQYSLHQQRGGCGSQGDASPFQRLFFANQAFPAGPGTTHFLLWFPCGSPDGFCPLCESGPGEWWRSFRISDPTVGSRLTQVNSTSYHYRMEFIPVFS